MAKKDKGKQRELELIDQVSASANDIWLAGLAAFEKAQREGGKVFSKLVKEGEKVESRTLEAAGNQLDDIRSRASGTWGKLENLFEARVERALSSLGVPTGHEVRNLATKVNNLGKSIESVGKRKATSTAKAKAKARPGKAAAVAKPKRAAKAKPAAGTKTVARAKSAAAAKPAARAKRAAAAKPATRARTAAAAKPAARARASAAAKPAARARPAPATKPAARRRAPAKRVAPAATTARGPDDLKEIGGIGPALERKLINYGITNYRQIAGWGSKEIEEVESKVIRIAGRVSRDNWIAQAKAAHQKKYGAKT